MPLKACDTIFAMDRAVVLQKVLGLGIVGLAIAFLSPIQIATAFAVFGQGHFLGAYYYQWKAGKMGYKWLASFLALAALLFWYGVGPEHFNTIAVVAAIFFFIHHFQDEIALFGKEHSGFRGLEILPPVLIYSALATDAFLQTAYTIPACGISAVVYAIYLALCAYKKKAPDQLSAYLATITAVLGALILSGVQIPPQTLLGSVILFHYVCWYVYFYFRFSAKPERQRQYIIDMVVIHVIVFAAFALFSWTPLRSVLQYVFLPGYFYIWAILHIVFSVRPQDYKALFSW